MVRTDAEYMYMMNFRERIEKTRENYITYYMLQITRDETWFNEVKRKALEQDVSVDEMLHRDASWMYEHDILEMHRN
jgi:hypothetical protein